MKTHVRPGAVLCVETGAEPTSGLILLCRLLLSLARLCIISTGIDTVEVWVRVPTSLPFTIACGLDVSGALSFVTFFALGI
jgi:hypothetical protein